MTSKNLASLILSVLALLCFMVILRYPIYLNSDIFLDSDDAFTAIGLMDLIAGNRFFLYQEAIRHVGLVFELPAIIFWWFLDNKHLAYSLPGIIYYTLYLWTTYEILGQFSKSAAKISLFLLLFCSPGIAIWTARNSPHVLLGLMGNIAFLILCHLKMKSEYDIRKFFFLGFIIGLSMYTYTFSLIFIAVVLFIFMLTHNNWGQIRKNIPFLSIIEHFRTRNSLKQRFIVVLDLVIILFILASVFAYAFGGWGVKLWSTTILQINTLHKPLIQICILIIVRIALGGFKLADLNGRLKEATTTIRKTLDSRTKSIISCFSIGLLIGLSPRITSLLSGESVRGGSGFHIELSPTSIFSKISNFFAFLPSIYGGTFQSFNVVSVEELSWWANVFLTNTILFLLILASASFISSNWKTIICAFRLQPIEFSPILFFLFYPIFLLIAIFINQGDPALRHLTVFYGMTVVWLGIFLDKVRKKTFVLFLIILFLWPTYNLYTNHQYFKKRGMVNGLTPIKIHEPLNDVISFFESNGIGVAYADYWVAFKTTMLSKNKLLVSEFTNNPRGKVLKKKTLLEPNFGVIVSKSNILENYRNFFHESRINYEEKKIGLYYIFYNFTGDTIKIQNLRSLIAPP